jgi:hypothetical protein
MATTVRFVPAQTPTRIEEIVTPVDMIRVVVMVVVVMVVTLGVMVVMVVVVTLGVDDVGATTVSHMASPIAYLENLLELAYTQAWMTAASAASSDTGLTKKRLERTRDLYNEMKGATPITDFTAVIAGPIYGVETN